MNRDESVSPVLAVDDIAVSYGDERAVDGASFAVGAGELVAVLGPSGCGKTTIVQTIAGHLSPDAGRIRLRGEDVTSTPPEARDVGVVFQRSTLYPHMTVAENVAYGLAGRDVDADEHDRLVTDYLDLVDLAGQRDAHPAALSGGQRRRAELARAIAPEPDVLVLDEPLSALDRTLRERLRDEIARIQDETGVATLYVTHDQETAMALADRLVVVQDGRVAGLGEPRALYESPPSPFVASFLGRSNELSGTLLESRPLTVALGDDCELAVERNAADGGVVSDTDLDVASDETDLDAGSSATCHVRPTALSLRPIDEAVDASAADARAADAPATGATARLHGVVTRVADLGRRYDVSVRVEGHGEVVVEQSDAPPDRGADVAIECSAADVTVFDADGRRIG